MQHYYFIIEFLCDVPNENHISWNIGSMNFFNEKQKAMEDFRHSASKEVNIGNISGSNVSILKEMQPGLSRTRK